MKNNSSGITTTDQTPSITEDFKEQNLKHNLSKFEYDLYHEEDDKVEKIIRVKRISMPNKGENWKIFEDNKILMLIDGKKLTVKEKEFLRSVDGATWLLSKAREGITSFNSFKKMLKEKLTS